MKSIIGERGQLVIPKQIRERLGLEKGTILEVETTADNRLIQLKPIRIKRRDWREWIGAFEEEGLIKEYLKLKKKEIEREKVKKWKK